MLKKILYNDKLDIADRAYLLFGFTMGFVLIFIIAANLAAGEWRSRDTLVYILMEIGIVAFVTKSIRSDEITFEPVASSFLFWSVLFPYIFLTRTAYKADIPIYMLIGFAFNATALRGKLKFIMNAVNSIIIIICYSLVYFNVIIPKSSPLTTRYIKSATGVTVTGVIISLLIIYQGWVYKRESKLVNTQAQEIKKINDGQSVFFSSMSHEIRTPLNTIIGLNEINLSMELNEDVEENFHGIRASSERLLELINDILDMSKIQSGKMEFVPMEFGLGKILTDVTGKIYKKAVKRSIEFNSLIDPDIPDILVGDEPKLKRILEALLTYAVAMTEKGYVKLFVRFEETAPGKIILCFEIEDTGVGIKRENIPYIFDMFSRQEGFNKNEDLLSGFELALSKNLTQIMGGSITVDSVYGIGTTLKIYLPMDVGSGSETVTLKSGQEVSVQDFRADSARILVVDDEGMNLRVFTNLIKPLGIASDTASSGEEALKLVSENRYDIVFIDHMMPGMDGIATLKAIKKLNDPPACTVALTAHAGNAAKKEYLDMGFTGYLSKPVDKRECFELIENLIPDKVKKKVTVKGDGELEKHNGEKENSAEKSPMEFGKREKLSIAITMDSVGNIPESYPERDRITVLPFYCITDNGIRYRDLSEISIYPLARAMKDRGITVWSAPPSVDEYAGFFMEKLRFADQVIHLSMAKNVSDGYNNACMAAEGLDNVYVVDSGSLSVDMGMKAVSALRMADAGLSRDEIINSIKDIDNNFAFVINDTTYLMRAGRMPKGVHNIFRLFNLRPVIKLINSKLKVVYLLRGDFEKSINDFVKKFLDDNASNEELIILHAGLSEEYLEILRGACKKKKEFKRVTESLTTAPVTANGGGDAYGLLYFKKVK